jgi:hypothetical protein
VRGKPGDTIILAHSRVKGSVWPTVARDGAAIPAEQLRRQVTELFHLGRRESIQWLRHVEGLDVRRGASRGDDEHDAPEHTEHPDNSRDHVVVVNDVVVLSNFHVAIHLRAVRRRSTCGDSRSRLAPMEWQGGAKGIGRQATAEPSVPKGTGFGPARLRHRASSAPANPGVSGACETAFLEPACGVGPATLIAVFGMSLGEFAILLLVAFVVIGPKELPLYLSKAGQLAGRARDWVRDFAGRVRDWVRDVEDDRGLVASALAALAIMTIYLIGLAFHIR